MAHIDAPAGVDLQPHLAAVAVDINGRVICASLTRNHGMKVWRVGDPDTNLLDALPQHRQAERALLYGAPMLAWRPVDGQLLIAAVEPDENGIMLLPVPGIFFDGRSTP